MKFGFFATFVTSHLRLIYDPLAIVSLLRLAAHYMNDRNPTSQPRRQDAADDRLRPGLQRPSSVGPEKLSWWWLKSDHEASMAFFQAR